VIDVSAHGVDRCQRAEPRKYVRAANIPSAIISSRPNREAEACLFDVTLETKRGYGCAKVEPVPPEEHFP
jgi:hypothetical protein